MEAQKVGKQPILCQTGSAFQRKLTSCQGCFSGGGGGAALFSQAVGRDLEQALNWCENEKGPQSQVTGPATTAGSGGNGNGGQSIVLVPTAPPSFPRHLATECIANAFLQPHSAPPASPSSPPVIVSQPPAVSASVRPASATSQPETMLGEAPAAGTSRAAVPSLPAVSTLRTNGTSPTFTWPAQATGGASATSGDIGRWWLAIVLGLMGVLVMW